MPHCTFRVLNGSSWELKGEFENEKGTKTAEQKIGERPVLFLARKSSDSAHFLSQPPPGGGGHVPCTFRVLNACSWELKGSLENEKGAKTAEQKIGERPVLILGGKSEPCGRRRTEKRPK